MFSKEKNFVAARMIVFDTLVVRGNRAVGRNPVRAQILPEGTHLVPSLSSSLTRNSLFELLSVDMLLITKEMKHRETDFYIFACIKKTRVVATQLCLVTMIL
jgi:hypothetical protein